ncbi:ABC transporter permease [Corynebacterium sp. CCM 9203]|uniref:ABC transporter permease n=1 Tax=Corynebacterium sp. CCM 9203 TaxID=3057615 RepID=UPI00352395A1
MRNSFSRLRPVIIAVTLGVFFLTSVLTFNDSLWKTTEKNLRNAFKDYNYAVTISGPRYDTNPINAELRDQILKVPGVSSIQPSVDSIGFIQRGTLENPVRLRSLDWVSEDSELISGSLPKAPNEILIDASIATNWGLSVGDIVYIKWNVEDADPSAAIISGLIETPGSSVPGSDHVVYGGVETINSIRDVASDSYSQLLIQAPESNEVLEGIRSAVSTSEKHPTVISINEFIKQKTRYSLPGATYIQMGVAGVLLAAFLVLVLVIRSVFVVRIEKDRRDYSLQRCLGASRGQIFRSVLGDAAGTGLFGAILGATFSLSIIAFVLLIPSIPMTFGTSVKSIIISLTLGTVVCIVGALGPAKQAMRNTPLGALRESSYTNTSHGTRKLVTTVTNLFFLLGVVGMVLSAYLGMLLVTIVISAITIALGLCLISGLIHKISGILLNIPGVERSVAATEALEKIRTHQMRSSSIGTLTAVTVAFIALIGTGSSTVFASINKSLTDVPLPSISISFDEDHVSAEDIINKISTLGIIKSSAVVETLSADVQSNGEVIKGAKIVKISPELQQAVQTPRYLEIVKPGTVFLGNQFEIRNGSAVKIESPGGVLELQADTRDEGTNYAYVTQSDFDSIGGEHRLEVWVKFADNVDVTDAVASLSQALSGLPVSYQGSSQQVAELEGYIKLLTTFALLLLTIGVLIAMVGISNTLRVSVMERTQEIGLQRALGNLRSDIRLSLVLETLLLTSLGALLGVMAGMTVAVSGVYSLVNRADELRFELGLPLGFFGLTIAVTIAVGACASLIASRRAVEVSPVQALRVT